MVENVELASTATLSINEPPNINFDIENASTTPTITSEEKSNFERAIIESFKQSSSSECIEKLSIAYDEVKLLAYEVKNSNGKKYILNKNLVDKLNRLSERNYFNLNILIAKIYESLLDTTNFVLLSNDLSLLISFSNHILNILDLVKSTNVSRNLEKKCSCFLNYLLINKDFNLDDDQKQTITELLNSFPTRNCSDSYKNFPQTKENIISLCKSESIEDKLEGILLLMEAFGDTFSLEEQFDLVLEYCPQIIKETIVQPNPENEKVYFQLGNFLVNMLYSYKFKIKADYKNVNINIMSSKSKAYFLCDIIGNASYTSHSMTNFQENNFENLLFLDGTLFELTFQKDLLLKCENIFSICNLVLNTLSIYDSIFDLQYICYLVLKRIYFTFPQFRKNIEDLIAVTLVNICMLSTKEKKVNSLECRQFLHYLLNCKGEDELKNKINHRIESKGKYIDISIDKNVSINETDVEFDVLNFGNFNLRIGFPYYYKIEAGSEFEKFIEIEHPNSLIYIGFATQSYDITCHLYKYIHSDEKNNKEHFIEIFKLEKIDCSELPVKIVIFVKEPGIYRLVFDNTYSWFTSKTIRYRLSILKSISEIDYSKKFPIDRNVDDNGNNIINNNESNNLNIKVEITDKSKSPHQKEIEDIKNELKNYEENNEENKTEEVISIKEDNKEQ